MKAVSEREHIYHEYASQRAYFNNEQEGSNNAKISVVHIPATRVRIPLLVLNAVPQIFHQRKHLLHISFLVNHRFAWASLQSNGLSHFAEAPRPPGLLGSRRVLVVPLMMIGLENESDQTIIPGLQAAFNESCVPDDDKALDTFELAQKLDDVGCEVEEVVPAA